MDDQDTDLGSLQFMPKLAKYLGDKGAIYLTSMGMSALIGHRPLSTPSVNCEQQLQLSLLGREPQEYDLHHLPVEDSLLWEVPEQVQWPAHPARLG